MSEASPDRAVSVDVSLVLQGYREMVSNQSEQIVIQSARIKMLEASSVELTAALQQASVALAQAQERENASSSESK